MNTTSILAVTVAALLLASGPTFAADGQSTQTQTQTQPQTETKPQAKRCYRQFHKLPYRIRTRCKTPKTSSEPVKSESGAQQLSEVRTL
jgi:hypothetical protein